jgi:hypothetical protein
MLQSGKCNQSSGAPSLPVFFPARVGYHESQRTLSWIPPFAKNAKDGAPALRGATDPAQHTVVSYPPILVRNAG